MIAGEIEIVPEERVLLQEIFSSYLKGMSLQRLAVMAEQTGLPFRENAVHWNKNMIARILDDRRYWNGNGFPPIVNKEVGSAITAMRKQKATAQCPIQFLQKRLVCNICGTSVSRNSKNYPRIYWNCKKCGNRFGAITDSELLEAVTKKLLAVCRAPQMAEPEPVSGQSLSLQAARLTNEINQILNQREVEPDRLLPLILECAAEKYKTCRIRESDHVTLRLLALLQEHAEDKELNRELFEQTVKQVILQSDGSVRLRLVNDMVI